MSYIEAETMSFNQIFDRDEDEYLEGDELLYWVRIFFFKIFSKIFLSKFF